MWWMVFFSLFNYFHFFPFFWMSCMDSFAVTLLVPTSVMGKAGFPRACTLLEMAAQQPVTLLEV